MTTKEEAIAEMREQLGAIQSQIATLYAADERLTALIEDCEVDDPELKRCPWCGEPAGFSYYRCDEEYSVNHNTWNYSEVYKGERDSLLFQVFCSGCHTARNSGSTKVDGAGNWNRRCTE